VGVNMREIFRNWATSIVPTGFQPLTNHPITVYRLLLTAYCLPLTTHLSPPPPAFSSKSRSLFDNNDCSDFISVS
jgi:hypothetical protein